LLYESQPTKAVTGHPHSKEGSILKRESKVPVNLCSRADYPFARGVKSFAVEGLQRDK
jgi:hypothetical protein